MSKKQQRKKKRSKKSVTPEEDRITQLLELDKLRKEGLVKESIIEEYEEKPELPPIHREDLDIEDLLLYNLDGKNVYLCDYENEQSIFTKAILFDSNAVCYIFGNIKYLKHFHYNLSDSRTYNYKCKFVNMVFDMSGKNLADHFIMFFFGLITSTYRPNFVKIVSHDTGFYSICKLLTDQYGCPIKTIDCRKVPQLTKLTESSKYKNPLRTHLILDEDMDEISARKFLADITEERKLLQEQIAKLDEALEFASTKIVEELSYEPPVIPKPTNESSHFSPAIANEKKWIHRLTGYLIEKYGNTRYVSYDTFFKNLKDFRSEKKTNANDSDIFKMIRELDEKYHLINIKISDNSKRITFNKKTIQDEFERTTFNFIKEQREQDPVEG